MNAAGQEAERERIKAVSWSERVLIVDNNTETLTGNLFSLQRVLP